MHQRRGKKKLVLLPKADDLNDVNKKIVVQQTEHFEEQFIEATYYL